MITTTTTATAHYLLPRLPPLLWWRWLKWHHLLLLRLLRILEQLLPLLGLLTVTTTTAILRLLLVQPMLLLFCILYASVGGRRHCVGQLFVQPIVRCLSVNCPLTPVLLPYLVDGSEWHLEQILITGVSFAEKIFKFWGQRVNNWSEWSQQLDIYFFWCPMV